MRWSYACDRETYSCSDQAPFPTRSPGCLRCLSSLIADHPTLLQAVATAALPTSQFSGGRAFYLPIGILPPILCLFINMLYTRQPTSIATFSPPMCSPSVPRPATVDSKRIAASCQNRKGFLHRAVSKPPRPQQSLYNRPIRQWGRGGSDTVLGINGRDSNDPQSSRSLLTGYPWLAKYLILYYSGMLSVKLLIPNPYCWD